MVKLSAFGDIIHALPALDDVLAHPDVSDVHWLIDSRFAFVANVLPKKVHVHTLALKGAHPWRDSVSCIYRLRRENFDIIIDLQGLIKSGALAWIILKNNTRPFGFDASQTPEWPNRLFVQNIPFHADEKHVVQIYRRITAAALKTTSISSPHHAMVYIPPHVPINAIMQQQGHDILQAWGLQTKQFIILHMGGSYSTKLLPEKTWRDLVQILLKKRNMQPLLLWGNDAEQQRAQRIAYDMPKAIIASKRLNIEALCGVLHSARFFVGADTGVTHLAAALTCPTITLWGATASQRMGALGKQDQHISSYQACSPCFKRQCNDIICMKTIKAQSIADKLQ
ncbi:MAG: lipopolysaccharide heptosyltransferase I [Mariprofundales bacterium]